MKKFLFIFLLALLGRGIQVSANNFWASDTTGCTPLVTLFSHSFSNVTSVYWNFGDGSNSTLSNPGKIYATSGTYTVALTITFSNSTTQTITKANYIRAIAKPSLNFNFTTNSGSGVCVNSVGVSFIGQGPTDVNYWEWDMGDGSSAYIQNPTYNYSITGSYTVTLFARNTSGCVNTVQKNVPIVINSGVKALFNANDSNSCNGVYKVKFENQSKSGVAITSYKWNFAGLGTSILISPSFTFPSPGTYNVRLIATNVQGCIDTLDKSVVITKKNFSAQISASDSVICKGSSVNFNGSETSNTYVWDFTSGTQTGVSISSNFPNAGTFNINAYVTDLSGCKDTASLKVVVYNTPTSTFTKNGDTSKCAYPINYSVNGNIQNAQGFVYTVKTAAGNVLATYSTPNFVHPFYTQGTYAIVLRAWVGNSCFSVDSQVVVINQLKLQASFTNSLDSGCVALNVGFLQNSVIPAGTTIASYKWNFDDVSSGAQNTATGTTSSHNFVNTGIYNVTLTATATSGCVSTFVKTIRTGTKPTVNFLPKLASGCSPFSMQFNSLSTNVFPDAGYLWKFNNITYAVANPMVLLAIPGTYSAALYVSNNGCTDSMIVSNAIVVMPPKASFTAPNRKGCKIIPHKVDFIDASTQASTWFWDFGDPTSGVNNYSTLKNPSHIYTAFDSYTVKLVVTNSNGCIDSIIRVAYVVITDPVARFTSNQQIGCKPFPVAFTNTSTAGTYSWDFGNTAKSTVTSPSYTYTKPGLFRVVLKITDSNSCTDSMVKVNHIHAKGPIVAFAPASKIYCLPAGVQFVDSTRLMTQVVKYTWNFGDLTTLADTSNLANPSYTYNANGDYNVQLIVKDTSGCSDTLIKIALIKTRNPIVSMTQDTIKCINNALNFNANAVNVPNSTATNYVWYFGDGDTAMVKNPSHSYTTSGLYTVKMIAINAFGCSDSIVKNNGVNIVKLNLKFGADPSVKFCAPQTINFKDSTVNSNTWAWNFGDGTTSTQKNPNKIYSKNGYYNVSLLVTSTLGCRDSLKIDSLVRIVGPTAKYDYVQLDTCAMSPVFFTNKSVGGHKFTWDFGNGKLDTSSNPSTLYAAGVYNPILIVKDSLNCSSTYNPQPNIYVSEGPVAKFTMSDSIFCDSTAIVTFTDSSLSTSRWFWDFGDGSTSTLQNPSHTYKTGSYTVKLVAFNANGCSDTVIVTNGVRLYANPKADFITSTTVFCLPVTANFQDKSTPSGAPITSWNWSFGTGINDNSTIQNPNFIYNTPGSYNVRLTITDANKCKSTQVLNNYIKVNDSIPPVMADIKAVSVNTKKQIELTWNRTSISNFDKYLVYRKKNIGSDEFVLLSELSNINMTYMIDSFVQVNQFSYCYLVLLKDQCGIVSTIDQSKAHCSILLKAKSLANNEGAEINWNHYKGWDPSEYKIYRRSVGSSQYTFLESVPGNVNTYRVKGLCSASYSFYVEANGTSGVQRSLSNKDEAEIVNSTAQLPSEIYNASVTADNKVELNWRLNGSSELLNVIIERRVNESDWNTMYKVVSPSNNGFIDENVKVGANSYSYRIRVQDKCLITSPLSNIGQTMLLKTKQNEDWEISLEWSAYNQWKNGVDYYVVERLNPNTNQFDSIGMSQNTENRFVYIYSNENFSAYKYRITAFERGGNNKSSFSNVSLDVLPITLYAPNVFTPNNDGTNDKFEVVGQHIKAYELKVFDRWGNIVFNTKELSNSWDGKVNNEMPKTGSYPFLIQAIGYDGRPIKIAGSVIIP